MNYRQVVQDFVRTPDCQFSVSGNTINYKIELIQRAAQAAGAGLR
jgi:hypothetical protein